ncbi:MAG TPA: tetratricopeptide repeat protein [Salinivirga sp.]|uniref:tetratricopeptide repeat protein n=1 Tax=Salinivirga sp. TaxID=1970192 RepID=UPI002B47F5F2|nr:tetratricopeptide repeat protein [Salinivirga sp.]HKK58434.1 tetratricopeptide repeat protein [Salinivirga sp.]
MKKIFIFLFCISLFYNTHGNEELIRDSVKIQLEQADNDKKKIRILNDIAQSLQSSNPDSALIYFNEALMIAEEHGFYKEIAEINASIGSAFYYRGGLDRVLKYYYEALRNFELAKDTEGLMLQYFNIGLAFNSLNKFAKSREYYYKSLELAREQNKTFPDSQYNIIISRIHNGIGVTLNTEGEYDTALYHFNKAIEISEKNEIKTVIPLAYNNIGNIHKLKGDYRIAQSFYEKSLAIRKNQKDYKGVALTYFFIGQTQSLMGKSVPAIDYFQMAMQLADSTSFLDLQFAVTDALLKEYAKNKQYEKTFELHMEYKKLNDSINYAKSLQTATQLEMQYKFDKIQQENKLKQQKKEFTYVLIIAITFALLIVSVLLFFLGRSRTKRTQLKQEKLRLEKENLENKLEFKNKELATNVMHLVRNNELATRVAEKLMKAKSDFKKSNQAIIQDIINELKTTTNEAAWKEFQIRFQEVHEGFYSKLNELFPDLTPNEQRLCAFLRLNMSSKEISAITFQSIKSIEVARTRLRKKLNLVNTDTNLVTYLMQLETK